MEDTVKINNYIIHLINKERQGEATIDLSKNILKHDQFSERLIVQLHKSIGESPSLKNTKFKEETKNIFSSRLDHYFDKETSDNFYDFTLSINQLFETISKIPFATGGYYLFADYELNKKRYITVSLLRKKNGLNIIKENGEFKLLDSENLSIDKIAMAFRLNFNLYSNSETEAEKNNYLTLITTQQDGEVSDYFKDWVNSGDLIKNTQNTTNLLNLLKRIELPKNEKGEDIYHNRYDFQNAIYDYAKSQRSKLLNVYDISRHFYGENNKNKIIDFAKESEIIIDPEFKKDARIWRRLITVKAKVDGIELNVSHDKFNDDDVKVLDDQIIIYSKKLVQKINSQRKNII